MPVTFVSQSRLSSLAKSPFLKRTEGAFSRQYLVTSPESAVTWIAGYDHFHKEKARIACVTTFGVENC